jgi:GT2 family glycosyltransferase
MRGVAEWQLVVADNASTDDTVDLVRTMAPDVALVQVGRNAGYAAGINAAVAAGPGSDAVLVSNPDIRPSPGSVRRLLDTLADPGTGIAVPRLLTGEGELIRSLRREPTVRRMLGEALLGGRRSGLVESLGEVVHDLAPYDREGVATWASGAFMLISQRCLETVGPWDESFFLYSEETDFALRVRDAGFLLRYTPAATVVHLEGEAHVSPRLYTMLTVNRSRLYARRHGRALSTAFTSALLLNEAMRSIGRQPTHRAALRALLSPGSRPPEVSGP